MTQSKRAAEARVIRLALAEYTRMRKLGYDRKLYGNNSVPQRLHDACRDLKASLARQRKGRKRD